MQADDGTGVPDGPPTLCETGEDHLVSQLLSRLAQSPCPPQDPCPRGPALLEVGPGDDAAVLTRTPTGGRLVLSTDTLVQGHDFRPDWSTPEEIGAKTAAQSFADVASMGARPLALLLSLAAPGHLGTDWALRLADGLAQECRRAGAVVAGGDVSAASEIVLTGTAVGLLVGPPVLRSGARVGDVVALAGRTGPSAAGLALLAAGAGGSTSEHAEFLAAHRAPRPDYSVGPVAAGAGAHALIDVSDGLLRDAARIAVASGVRVDLDPEALRPDRAMLRAAGTVLAARQPLVSRQPLAARSLRDPEVFLTAREWVLSGGEDHAFLGCFDPSSPLPRPFRPVGRVLALPRGPGGDTGKDTVAAVTVGGQPWEGSPGWTHFNG
ncbi:MAG: thiamine-monophosphate kinase [Actinomycetota bacterium]|nr:thiamine-monophosphate kinase [Actinomycetota bacterium]